MLAGLGLIFLASLKKRRVSPPFLMMHKLRAIALALDSLVVFFVQNQVLIVGF